MNLPKRPRDVEWPPAPFAGLFLMTHLMPEKRPEADNRLAEPYSLSRLLRFATPSIMMMLFFSLYTIVDGIFIARYAGSMALSSINMFFPAMSLIWGVIVMLGTGGSALIATKLGERRTYEARAHFSALALIMAGSGFAMAVCGNIFSLELVTILGASELQFQDCLEYTRMFCLFAPLMALQYFFQVFFVAAGRPGLGLAGTLGAGFANMALDYLFIVHWGMGVRGAALGTGLACIIPTLLGLVWFTFYRQDELHFAQPHLPFRKLLRICSNGFSEMVTHLANFTTGYLFNLSFMQYVGEQGVAALTIVFYFEFVFTAVFFGYSGGVSPIISYKHGARNSAQLRFIFRSSLGLLVLFSFTAYLVSLLTLPWTLPIFLPVNDPVYSITRHGFYLYAFAFLFMGINIFSSAFFTALSNGAVSAIISFGRTFVFLSGCILLLPRLWGENGLWLAAPLAELLGMLLALAFLILLRRRYRYA